MFWYVPLIPNSIRRTESHINQSNFDDTLKVTLCPKQPSLWLHFPFILQCNQRSLFNRKSTHLNTQCFGPHSARVIVGLSISVPNRKYWFKLLRLLSVQAPACVLFWGWTDSNQKWTGVYFIWAYFPIDKKRLSAVYCLDFHPEKAISMKWSLQFITIGRKMRNQGWTR